MKVFLDVDGVLIDGWHAKPERRKSWDAAIEQDLGAHRAAFHRMFFGSPGGASGSPMETCLSGDRDLKEALAEVLPAVGYGGKVDTFVDYWFEKDSNTNRDVLGVVERLAQHRHVALYLVNAQEHYRAAYLWNELGFKDFFKDILCNARLGCLKGTPEFFIAVNAALGLSSTQRPLFFDDHEGVVQLARDAGWDACVFDSVQDLLQHSRLCPLLQG